MNTWIKVARYHLVGPASYLMLAWILPFSFAVGAVTAGRARGHDAAGYLASFFIYFAVLGVRTIGRSLPFSLTLGASRRSFYCGTALLGMALALACGLVLTALQAVERATGGWGLSVRFFRVPYLLDGPWPATWLTSAVGLFALFVYGMWCGIVYSRWGLLGTLAFIAMQALVVAAGVVVVTFDHWHLWSAAGGSLVGLTGLGLTGVIAALTVLLLAGGHATIRRVTV
ncbi:hypothetical protein KGA66_07770 [Actinocrinis puniceicyclus]|uniref:Uncharacterized protein n=1 Tax=Actinocrinis puniceicyclus TaxID=977794 RepID=A0A8J7WIP9_9ACTN|nr:hypothetical protein [Actinocrinis puniceicyclus]MBS2962936.1 hypothetical protein [Actinocrinis puniceicyclus]